MSDLKRVHVFGGGTLFHVRNHLALSAPAYGETAREIARKVVWHPDSKMDVVVHLSRMCQRFNIDEYLDAWEGAPNLRNAEVGSRLSAGKRFETPQDLAEIVEDVVSDVRTKIVFFNPAVVDFRGEVDELQQSDVVGKHAPRVQSGGYSETSPLRLALTPLPKVIDTIRAKRKDIFLVSFKTTTDKSDREMYLRGLEMLKRSSSNLVLVNDVVRRRNVIVTPEESTYGADLSRDAALNELVDMALKRSHLTFTRSTVISGEGVSWASDVVPATLRKVVEHCIERGAYQRFRGSTTGHFAFKVDDTTFVTSKRKTDFNSIRETGMVMVKTDGPDTVLAYGAKPSVGGQSQRIVFRDHPGLDCIVHFHCALKPGSKVPVRSQREFECGSHECGANTSKGLMVQKQVGLHVIKAVFLDNHGPNVVFNHRIDPQHVIDFIEENFDLQTKTGGYNVEDRN